MQSSMLTHEQNASFEDEKHSMSARQRSRLLHCCKRFKCWNSLEKYFADNNLSEMSFIS